MPIHSHEEARTCGHCARETTHRISVTSFPDGRVTEPFIRCLEHDRSEEIAPEDVAADIVAILEAHVPPLNIEPPLSYRAVENASTTHVVRAQRRDNDAFAYFRVTVTPHGG